MSPFPRSFSAPTMSRIVRESTPLDTAKAALLGIFALISPVITSTLGRWVAIIRWMPQALASWARRQMDSSTSPGHTIIRSASSSTIMTIWGSLLGAFSSPFSCMAATFLL